MPARLRYLVVGFILASAAGPAPADAPKPPPDADALKRQADAAEKAGDWDKALELHLRAYLGGRQTADTRDHIRDCLRNASQARRQRDPGFQQFVSQLPAADALNLYAEAVGRLQTHYADRDKAAPENLFAAGLDEFDRALADPAFRGKHLPATPAAAVSKFRRGLQIDWRLRLPKTAREARQAVREVAAAAAAEIEVGNPAAVVFEFLCGACGGLDEYTVYLNPGHARSELASPVMELAGYGILIAFRDDMIMVDGVLPDSWAATQSAVRPGDRLVRANGRPLQPGTAAALGEALRNPIDGEHELEFLPPASLMAVPARLPMPVPTVIRADMPNPKDGVGYVRLSGIRSTTPAELDAAVNRLRARGLRGLVLDLRGNPGGLFAAGVQVAQRFLPDGVIATTQGQAAEFANRVFSSDTGPAAYEFPVVLLLDTKTMSAAEVVAAALKEHNRAVVVGMPTFGKGVIQYPFPLRAADDGADPKSKSGVLIVTIAKAFSPRGNPIHGAGVTPHLIEADPQRQLAVALERAAALVNGR